MRKDSSGKAHHRASVDEQLERCVQFALRGAAPDRTHDERRRQQRHPFPYPVRLIPVNARGEAIDEPLVVLGKHLTNQGLDFYCQHPVSHRRVIASFDCELADDVEMLMDLTWCRFNGHGWYENGGRFLSVVNPVKLNRPLDIAVNVESVVSAVDSAQV
ncbi:MAG: hypothetical protein H8E66_09015 [Planctomycetes bacterium]|nr:hypothetical protein [Planctomycetota bacterium]